jgi:hypothetical protein
VCEFFGFNETYINLWLLVISVYKRWKNGSNAKPKLLLLEREIRNSELARH